MKLLRHLPRFRHAARSLGPLAAREQWTRNDIEQWQLERLNAVWSHAVRHVPYYRELRAASHLPQRFDCLQQYFQSVPVLPRGRVQRDHRAFLSECASHGKWKISGGSTGQPTAFYWPHVAHQEVMRAKYRLHEMWDVDFFDRFVFLWGHTASFAPGIGGQVARLTQPLTDWLRNRKRLSAYRLDADQLRRHLRRIERARPTAMYGYSTAVYLLAEEALKSGITVDSLKAVILTAEPAHQFMRQTISRAFQAPVVVEYGAAECDLIAGQWPDGTLRVREDVVITETLPRDDGRFDIVLSVLLNPAFPLLRYALGDVTDDRLIRPAQGFSILNQVIGRQNDFVRTTSGRLVHPTLLMSLLGQTKGVRRYQIRQARDGSIHVQIEAESVGCRVDVDRIIRGVRDAVGGQSVSAELSEIDPTFAGKHRWIVSELHDLWSMDESAENNMAGILPMKSNTDPRSDNSSVPVPT